jgi:hypothetical protein
MNPCLRKVEEEQKEQKEQERQTKTRPDPEEVVEVDNERAMMLHCVGMHLASP